MRAQLSRIGVCGPVPHSSRTGGASSPKPRSRYASPPLGARRDTEAPAARVLVRADIDQRGRISVIRGREHDHVPLPRMSACEANELALRLARSHDQHRVGITDHRNDLIIVPVEMFTKASVTPVFGRAFWGMRRKAAMGLHL